MNYIIELGLLLILVFLSLVVGVSMSTLVQTENKTIKEKVVLEIWKYLLLIVLLVIWIVMI